LGARPVLTKSDLAKYPFTPEAADYIKQWNLKIENLENPDYGTILKRAEKRIEEALVSDPPRVSYEEKYEKRNDEVEIPSFPVAIILAAGTGNDYVKRRYALAEATRSSNLLQRENEKIFLEVANTFKWRIKTAESTDKLRNYAFTLHFIDFLENAKNFHEKEWKLINRVLRNGWVCLTKHEAARLLQEEVRRHVEKKLEANVRPMLPPNVIERVDTLVHNYAGKIEKVQFEELPKEAVNAAFPPCIRKLYDDAAAGRHLSHVGRFALTSFLLRVGVPQNEVVDLFRSFADFNERMTRYQVEHISGARGSRTSYIPPKCDTLRTHSVCPDMDDICRKVHHPLAYYRRKLRTLKKEAT